MDTPTALSCYVQTAIKEREEYLYQAALKKARSLTRNMTAKETEDYLQSPAFANLLYQVQRRDKAYQALKRGELALEFHQAEFQRLQPMIDAELRRGATPDIEFIRSVDRSRVSMRQAREALKLLEQGAPRAHLEERSVKLCAEAAGRVDRYLRRNDFSDLKDQVENVENVLSHMMKTTFGRGITTSVVDRAYLPDSLSKALQSQVCRAYPALAACGNVRTGSGASVSAAVAAEVRRFKGAMCARIRKRFPVQRVRRLLSVNPSVKRLQSQADAAIARERGFRSALLDAVPEHYRDLYPLARAMRRRFILHIGPTNSGKTYEGVGRLHGALNGIYLGPLRLLAAEQFETLNMNDVPCSLVTGEEQIMVPGSRVQSSTVEMADLKARYDVAVIDECQMIADRDRGGAWTAAIMGLCADEIHACASEDAEELLTRIIRDCGDELSIVRHSRMTPLELEKEGFRFPESVRPGDALIVFSKARVHAVAAELKRLGYRVSLIYGALPPDVRRDQAVRFQRGESDVVVSTDAIAMGMNLPIERVVFLESEKYDGDITRPLLDSEIKQIAGRAGRYGQYDIGYVNAFGFKSVVGQALNKPLLPITEAIIGFPESLLGLPMPLTGIIRQWLVMKDKSCFSKASTARMESLAAMMEGKNTDKRLLYRFLCIPFDENEPDLLARWRAMYHAECHREHIDVISQIPPLLDPDECTTGMLDGLEADYRRCDLYYNYARLFLEEPDAILDEIQRRKYLISQGIIHILSTQRLQQRSCQSCKRYLPWNWPYRLCEDCHRRQRGFRGRGGRNRSFEDGGSWDWGE